MRKGFQNFLRWIVFHCIPRFIFERMTPCESIALDLVDEKVSWRKRLSIRIHLIFCYSCWIYNKQLHILQKKLADFYRKISELPPEKEKHVDELADIIIAKNSGKK